MQYEEIVNMINVAVQDAVKPGAQRVKTFWWWRGEIIHLPSREALKIVIDYRKQSLLVIRVWWPLAIRSQDYVDGANGTAIEQVARILEDLGENAA